MNGSETPPERRDCCQTWPAGGGRLERQKLQQEQLYEDKEA